MIDPRALCMLSMYSSAELCSQALTFKFKGYNN